MGDIKRKWPGCQDQIWFKINKIEILLVMECRRGDSNPHELNAHMALNHACLPNSTTSASKVDEIISFQEVFYFLFFVRAVSFQLAVVPGSLL